MNLRRVHRWLGLALSLLLCVISITGILLVWKPEYLRFTVPDADAPLQTSNLEIAQSIDNILAAHPTQSVRLIQVQPHDLSLYKVFLEDQRYAWHAQGGELVQRWSNNERLEAWLLDLHHRFLLGNTIGLNMAGFSGILLVPLVMLGFYLWWPNRHAASFTVLPQGSRPGQLLRSHRNIGVISVIPILIVAITGVILVYPVESARVLLGDYANRAKPYIYTPEDSRIQPSTEGKLNYALAQFPVARIRSVRPPNGDFQTFIIGLQQADSWDRLGRTQVTFSNGEPVEISNALQQETDKRLFDFMFPLHTGLLPLWYRLLLSLFGLLLLLVGGFGVVAYLKRQFR